MLQKSFANYLLSIESLLNMAENFVPFSAKNTWILDWALTHLSARILKPLAQPVNKSPHRPLLSSLWSSNRTIPTADETVRAVELIARRTLDLFVCLYYFFQFGRSRRMWFNECFSPVTFPHPIWNEWKDTLGNLRLKHTSAFTHHQVYSQQDQMFNRQYVMLSVSLMESCNDWLH